MSIVKLGMGFVAFATILSAPISIPYIIDSFNMVHSAPTECSAVEGDEAFCERRYFDDGLVRFSSSPSERGNCCIMERRSITNAASSYRLLACDMQDAKPISCGAVESY
jgi:hypothetical protein